MYAPDDDVQRYSMMSQSVVLECQQGSEIWLRASTSYCYVYGGNGERESVFGGIVLHRL